MVENALQETQKVDRGILLVSRKKENPSRIPIVLQYNKLYKPVIVIIYKKNSHTQHDNVIGPLFPKPPMLVYKRDSTLCYHLVGSDLKQKENVTENPGTFTCNRNRCKTCFHTSTKTKINGRTGIFKIQKHFTCISEGVIYAIHCIKCGDLYIG